tara:strand:- start:9873 stop:11915 length:2043 start_codon:yes stop_codon:yes gene_type:complete
MLRKLSFPPGINHNSTTFSVGESWYDCNNIRFRSSKPERIAGWLRDESYDLDGIARSLFSSRSYVGNRFYWVGTNRKFYVVASGVPVDITPNRKTGTINAAGAFEAVEDDPFLTVNDASHGLSVNDWVIFTSVTTGSANYDSAALQLSTGFQVFEVVNSNKYKLYITDADGDAKDFTGTSITWNPASAAYIYKVASGSSTQVEGNGWGAGPWGDGGWGEASSVTAATASLRNVYIDNYGEDIVFLNSGGPLYYYDVSANMTAGVPKTSPSTDVAKIFSSFAGSSETPSVASSFVISKRDGHCVALGCNDIGSTDPNDMLVRWSDQNNPFDWKPTATNTSGGQVLRLGSRILSGASTKDEVIIFTDSAVYSMRFIGPPDVFSFNLVTQGVSIMGPMAAVNASNAVFFMGNDGFYVYSGAVEPLSSSVSNYVFDNFNFEQSEKVFASVNSGFSEVTWFYCSRDSIEPDRFVTFNYEGGVWYYGTFDMSSVSSGANNVSLSNNRVAWRDSNVFSVPSSTFISKYQTPTTSRPFIEKSGLFLHETGNSANGNNFESYVETGDLDISDGERFSFISRVIPDMQVFNADTGTFVLQPTITLYGKDFPGQTRSSSSPDGNIKIVSATFGIDSTGEGATYTPASDLAASGTAIRMRARSVAMRFSSNAGTSQWRLGDTRLEIRPDGRR